MARCRICKAVVKLKFETADITICTRCVKTINDARITVPDAEQILRERYSAAVERGITRQLSEASTLHEVERLERRLGQLDAIVSQRFQNWLNDLLQEEDIWGGNDLKRAVKFIRAHRRGLIAPRRVFYARPSDWEDRAHSIRKRDGYQCKRCGARDTVLHVHHIIHLQNSGTNRAANLITLCFDCHQAQHDYPISIRDGDRFGVDMLSSTDDCIPEWIQEDEWSETETSCPGIQITERDLSGTSSNQSSFPTTEPPTDTPEPTKPPIPPVQPETNKDGTRKNDRKEAQKRWREHERKLRIQELKKELITTLLAIAACAGIILLMMLASIL